MPKITINVKELAALLNISTLPGHLQRTVLNMQNHWLACHEAQQTIMAWTAESRGIPRMLNYVKYSGFIFKHESERKRERCRGRRRERERKAFKKLIKINVE